jgi:pyrroline-5-carboxylate reductase
MATLREFFPSLGFIGAGNMAGALLRGTVGRGALDPEGVWACDVMEDKLEALAEELKIHTTSAAPTLAENVATVVLSVKPQDLAAVADAIRDRITPGHLLISIAAGTTLATLAARLPPGTRLMRVMPNTPALVGAGAAGVAAGEHATPRDRQAALALMGAVGVATEVSEVDMDAVTALSGSGPAYIFRMMEILIQGGVEMGLHPKVARTLAMQTFLGAARLAVESGEDPAELRRKVTSPGGTTAAALEVFDAEGLEDVLKAGLKRARDRSIELAQQAASDQ